ncbi:SpoIIE family protein phosphatase [Limibacter armeniacum]|uniref:PP2C family protein-serine/threonine phosphatase n=1 Tax=Limibacter armeniacum TaxID=466084 RepID=UPI002FE667A4
MARRIARASLLISLFTCSYAALCHFVAFDLGITIMLGATALYFLLPLLLRTSLGLVTIGNILLAFSFVMELSIVVLSGGIESPVLPWLSSIPVAGLLLANKLSAICWAILCTIAIIALGVGEMFGMSLPLYYDASYLTVFAIQCLAGLPLIIFFLNLIFVKERDVAQNALQESYEELEVQAEEIAAQRDDIHKKSFLLEQHNNNITASINYAKRIQNASLPSEKRLQRGLKNHFVLYKPRDIVSGDFYWFARIGYKTIIAAVDCTGHGVPGAFMSMIGTQKLNEIVKTRNITSPNLILHQLHLTIKEDLDQNNNENKDGMDIAICVIDDERKVLEYAGAKNPLVYIQDGEMKVVKGSKFPIGGNLYKEEPIFDKFELPLDKPTTFYIYSDGYQDQFGGENNRKFMSKRFRELLYEIHKLPMDEQKVTLIKKLEEWKGYDKQLDDILVIGVQI